MIDVYWTSCIWPLDIKMKYLNEFFSKIIPVLMTAVPSIG